MFHSVSETLEASMNIDVPYIVCEFRKNQLWKSEFFLSMLENNMIEYKIVEMFQRRQALVHWGKVD